MTLFAVGTKIIVQRDPKPAPMEGALILPDEVDPPPRTGTVLSVGAEVKYDIREGDRVYFHEYAGHFLDKDLEDVDLLSLGEDEILAGERDD